MKYIHYSLVLPLLLLSFSSYAQKVKVTLNGGKVIKYNTFDVTQIEFEPSDEASQETSTYFPTTVYNQLLWKDNGYGDNLNPQNADKFITVSSLPKEDYGLQENGSHFECNLFSVYQMRNGYSYRTSSDLIHDFCGYFGTSSDIADIRFIFDSSRLSKLPDRDENNYPIQWKVSEDGTLLLCEVQNGRYRFEACRIDENSKISLCENSWDGNSTCGSRLLVGSYVPLVMQGMTKQGETVPMDHFMVYFAKPLSFQVTDTNIVLSDMNMEQNRVDLSLDNLLTVKDVNGYIVYGQDAIPELARYYGITNPVQIDIENAFYLSSDGWNNDKVMLGKMHEYYGLGYDYWGDNPSLYWYNNGNSLTQDLIIYVPVYLKTKWQNASSPDSSTGIFTFYLKVVVKSTQTNTK